jgi:hypothetical protein
MSTTPGLPLWVQDREEVLKQDDGVEWRDGNRPHYSRTNAFLEKERKHNHAEGSLNAIHQTVDKTRQLVHTLDK